MNRMFVLLSVVSWTAVGSANANASARAVCGSAPSCGAQVVLELTPTSANPRNSEGDFIRLRDGTLLYAWSSYYEAGAKEHASWDNGGANIVLRRSADDGKTWSATDEMIVRNDAMNVMSVSFLRLADGRIALFYIRKLNSRESEILMRTSSDEAKTWSEAVKVSGCLQKGWYVLNNARVIQLKTGRILVPLARHLIAEDGRIVSAARLLCVASDDGGASWRAGETVEVVNCEGHRIVTQEPGVIELGDGRVLMWARTDARAQYAGVSSDGGLTWGAFGPTSLVGPLSPATIKRLSSGRLVAVWNDHTGHPERRNKRTPLSIAFSSDEGRSWTKSISLEEDVDDWFCYVALTEADGDLLLAYCVKKARNLDSVRITRVPLANLTAF